MTEQWRPVVGWEGAYEVSDRGRVRSLERKTWSRRGKGFWQTVPARILRPSMSRGYLRVVLQRDGRLANMSVHHLVLTAFVGPCPDGLEACHYDDDPRNNGLTNLRWDTRAANHADRTRNGGSPNALKSECPSGHPYTPENTYRNPNGSRKCRACAIRRAVTCKQRRRAARKAAA